MTDYLLLIPAIILLLSGIVGCIIPGVPGPPLSYAGLIILHFTRFAHFTPEKLLILGIVAATATLLDYFVPLWGARRFGGSKYGVWGAAIGVVAGLFFGPPGIIIGPFLGAFLGELIHNNDASTALKAGLGSFLGFIAGIGLKLVATFIIVYYFIRGML